MYVFICINAFKGPFTKDIIRRSEGGFQKVTPNDGEGGVWTKRTSSKLYNFQEKFWENYQLLYFKTKHLLNSQQSYKMVAKNSLNPNRLPPTIVAATKHILRAYLLNAESLNTLDYGWKLAPGGTYEPVATKALIVQEHICLTIRCSCRKYGSNCIPACGPYHE